MDLSANLILAQATPPALGLPGDAGGARGVDPALSVYWDAENVIGKTINVALGFTSVIAIIMIVLGGFWYLTAAGNEEQAKKGSKYILYALVGVIILTFSYAIAFTLLAAPSADWDREDIEYNTKTGAIEWLGDESGWGYGDFGNFF